MWHFAHSTHHLLNAISKYETFLWGRPPKNVWSENDSPAARLNSPSPPQMTMRSTLRPSRPKRAKSKGCWIGRRLLAARVHCMAKRLDWVGLLRYGPSALLRLRERTAGWLGADETTTTYETDLCFGCFDVRYERLSFKMAILCVKGESRRRDTHTPTYILRICMRAARDNTRTHTKAMGKLARVVCDYDGCDCVRVLCVYWYDCTLMNTDWVHLRMCVRKQLSIRFSAAIKNCL